jgi:hypothetical protein
LTPTGMPRSSGVESSNSSCGSFVRSHGIRIRTSCASLQRNGRVSPVQALGPTTSEQGPKHAIQSRERRDSVTHRFNCVMSFCLVSNSKRAIHVHRT